MKDLSVVRPRATLALLFSLLISVPPGSLAASASAHLTIAVRLAPASGGICLSETISAQAHAAVQVTCASGHFVSMSPQPGQAFAGTHGLAHRFLHLQGLSAVAAQPPSSQALIAATPHAEVAAMRIAPGQEPVEILVSF